MGNNRKQKNTRYKPRMSYQRHAEEMQEIALERILYLYTKAWAIYESNPELANRYILHIRRLSMATKIRIPLELKRNICHHCKQLLVPGKSMRFRLHHRPHFGSYISMTCLHCGHTVRYIFKGQAYRRLFPSISNTELSHNENPQFDSNGHKSEENLEE